MKTFLFIAFVFLMISCERETYEPPTHHGKLKRKLTYHYIGDTIPYRTSDYEYDSKDRLIRIQDQVSADLFKYNENDELIRKYSYRIDGFQSILRDTTVYTYQNGILIAEESFAVPESPYSYAYQINYEYENSKLVKKTEYTDHHFGKMTLYEYKNDLLAIETTYTDSLKSRYYFYIDYAYDDLGRLSVSSMRNFDGGFLVAGYYFYDEDGNLSWEYGEQIAEVAAVLGFYNRYEYY